MVPKPEVPASSGNLLEMQIFGGAPQACIRNSGGGA